MADAGADTFTFHLEEMYEHDAEGNEIYDEARCNEKVYEIINKIKTNETRKMKVGMTVRTDTPVERLKPFLDSQDVDTVMIMCIPLGFGGQPFNEDMMKKVSWLRQNYPTLDIEVDGGLGPKTIELAATAGANIIVAGSAVYGQEDLKMPITELIRAVEKYGNKMADEDMTPMPEPDTHDKQ
jgi:ribulose-phosphate 3-epimerase